MAFKTAAEMKKITEESIMPDIKNILQEMESCAKQGKIEYYIDGSLSFSQKQKLRELGYSVQTGKEYNQPWAIISW